MRLMTQIMNSKSILDAKPRNSNSHYQGSQFGGPDYHEDGRVKNIGPRAKEKIERVNNENRRLYGRIISIDNQLQFGFLGLNKTKARPQDRALEAGLILKAQIRTGSESCGKSKIKLQSMKSILEKDRTLRDVGGHSSKFLQAEHHKIDAENQRILRQIQE